MKVFAVFIVYVIIGVGVKCDDIVTPRRIPDASGNSVLIFGKSHVAQFGAKKDKDGTSKDNSRSDFVLEPSLSCGCVIKTLKCSTPYKGNSAHVFHCADSEKVCCSSSKQLAVVLAESPPIETPRGFIPNSTTQRPRTTTQRPPRTSTTPQAEEEFNNSLSTWKLPVKHDDNTCTCEEYPNCPSEHRDFSFGISCPFGKVKCCKPKPTTTTTAMPTTSSTTSKPTTTTEVTTVPTTTSSVVKLSNTNNQCLCLPATTCIQQKSGLSNLERRAFQTCPSHLVLCCQVERRSTGDSDDNILPVAQIKTERPVFQFPSPSNIQGNFQPILGNNFRGVGGQQQNTNNVPIRFVPRPPPHLIPPPQQSNEGGILGSFSNLFGR